LCRCVLLGCVASAMTGIASLLLPGGMTAHSRFGVPLRMEDKQPRSSLKLQDEKAKVLRDAELVVIDEATMGEGRLFSLIDALLRDIMSVDKPELAEVPFGGKVVVLSGDFRQLPPVVPRGGRAGTVNAALQSHPLWSVFRVLRMTRNMRVERLLRAGEVDEARRARGFADWLLRVGDGLMERVIVPPNLLMPFDSPMAFVDRVFPDLAAAGQIGTDACILTTLNKYVDEMNDRVLQLVGGQEHVQVSADYFPPDSEGLSERYPVELLNTLLPSGLPPHRLVMKEGAPVVFLRNLSRKLGMMNGTRAVVRRCAGTGCFYLCWWCCA
jgi:ATP-dependent DNA helicase PIF1